MTETPINAISLQIYRYYKIITILILFLFAVLVVYQIRDLLSHIDFQMRENLYCFAW